MKMSEISNGVRVFVRERPSADDITIISHKQNHIFVEERLFLCDHFFPSATNQDEVYADVKPLIKKFIDGYGCTILAYGQSGTGKSYTMGLQCENVEISCNGIVPRALKDILDVVARDENSAVWISFLEIYNEKVFDLLSDSPAEQINTKGSKFTGRVKRPLRTLFDAEVAIIEGNSKRHVRPTAMNNNSSRSHGIFIIQKDSTSLYMVDLAGSEGVRRTGHKGEALAEGSHINLGLLGIGNILKALSDGNCYIPYRDTVLGSVLQDSLNANSYLALVVCISGNKCDESETTNSLTFAQKVMNYKTFPKTVTESKKRKPDLAFFEIPVQLQKKKLDVSSFETPAQVKRPLATSTAVLSRSNFRNRPKTVPKCLLPAPLSVLDTSKSLSSQAQDIVMASPNLTECVRALNRTLQKKNLMIQSLNLASINDNTITQDTDDTSIIENNSTISESELNSTVIRVPGIEVNSHNIENGIKVDSPIIENIQLNSTVIEEVPCTTDVTAKINDTSTFMTREECMKLVQNMEANFTKMVVNATATNNAKCENQINDRTDVPNLHEKNGSCNNQPNVLGNDNKCTTNAFEFKVPDIPSDIPKITSNVNPTNRRRSVRISLQKQRTETLDVPQNLPPPPVKQRRKTAIGKKETQRNAVIDQTNAISNSGFNKDAKTIHSTFVLNLLNTGNMKDIQILPQVGMKTAYGIITHRSIHGKFKNFGQLSAAPFWRGKGWQRFEMANNLV